MISQERVRLEREGARFARQYIDAAKGFVQLLSPYVGPEIDDEAKDAVVALLSGYLGVLFDDMPDVPPEAFSATFDSFAGGFPEALRTEIRDRLLVSLLARRQPTLTPTAPSP